MDQELKSKLNVYANLPNYSDIEAIGFWDVVHSTEDIHVLANIVVDPDTEEEVVLVFHDRPDLCGQEVFDPYDKQTYTIPERVGTLLDGYRYWFRIGQSEDGYLSVHNAGTYDLPIVEKTVPKCIIPVEKWEDTFIHSKIQWFDRPCPKGAKSAHGLNAYGIIHGIKKPEITDFTKMDAMMLHRVIEDCKIQRKTSEYLSRERQMLKQKLGIDLTEAYKMEFAYAQSCHRQEVFGAAVDLPHMQRCVETWDKRLAELESVIVPLLPPTVKVTGGKVSRKEMAILLGYPASVTDKMVEPMEQVKRNGEVISQPVKPYYKPSVNFTREAKSTNYSGMHISYGFSPSFVKKKDLTDWIKENHPDTRPKDWDIEKSETIAIQLNANTCKYFDLEPHQTDIVVGAHTRVKFVESSMTQHEVTKGELIKAGIKWVEEWNLAKNPEGGLKKADRDMTVSYPPKAAPENQIHIDIKKGEPIPTSPKFSEKDLEQVEGGLGTKIKEFNTTIHRRRYLSNLKDPENKGLMAAVREDGRVPAGVSNFGTATGRGAHRVIVNLPSDSAPLGKEMRQCIIAPKGKELVGIDQKSSQLSICSFVTNNTKYYEAVATGVEFENDEDGTAIYVGSSAHCVNAQYFDLVTREEWQEAIDTQNPDLIHEIVLKRKKSKGLSFASLFGCGAKKLAVMGGFSEEEAAKKLKSFLDNMGLSGVIEFLEGCKEKYKRGRGFYIPSAWGYWIYCGGMHKAVNYLIQNMESSVQKRAVLLIDQMIKDRGWEGKVNRILDMHDEVLMECDEGMGVEVGIACCECYTQVGVELNQWFKDNLHVYSGGGVPQITCDFAGGYAVGKNYYECH